MFTRRSFVLGAGALLALGSIAGARAQRAPRVVVYKSPTCGCCTEWSAHMRANGFHVEVHNVADMAAIERQYGVPDELLSCHTAVVEGYVIEGHVPASDIRRLLREKRRVKGLAVPGMPNGSPGMEQGGPPDPYVTVAFDGTRSWVYAQH